MRVSIKPYLADYITQVASQLGIDDITEVVSIILLDHKRGICHCSQARPPELSSTPVKTPNDSLADGLEELLDSASY